MALNTTPPAHSGYLRLLAAIFGPPVADAPPPPPLEPPAKLRPVEADERAHLRWLLADLDRQDAGRAPALPLLRDQLGLERRGLSNDEAYAVCRLRALGLRVLDQLDALAAENAALRARIAHLEREAATASKEGVRHAITARHQTR